MPRFAVVGYPASHSLSPFIHQRLAHHLAIAIEYEQYEVKPGTLADFLRAHSAFAGFNIKYPLKQEALAYASESSLRARKAGAASCLAIKNSEVFADNFDGEGLLDDLEHIQQVSLVDARVCVIGAGNVAASVLPLLVAKAPGECVVTSRSLVRARDLVTRLALASEVSVMAITALVGTFDVILNLTPSSLHDEVPAIPAAVIGPNTLCYDVEYAQVETAFERFAKAHQANACNGVGMLVAHNARVFELWHGVSVSQDVLLAVYQETLSSLN